MPDLTYRQGRQGRLKKKRDTFLLYAQSLPFESVRVGCLMTKRLPEMFYTLRYSVSSLAAPLWSIRVKTVYLRTDLAWHLTAFNLPSQPGSHRVPEIFNILWLRKVYL